MDDNTYFTNMKKSNGEQQMKLLHRGRQLHDEAISQMLLLLVTGLRRLLRKLFGEASAEPEYDSLAGKITAKR